MMIRNFLLTISIPIQKIMQKIHPPYAQTTVSEAEAAMKMLQDGDILISREKLHFTNMFIKGFWSHAAIYGKGKVVEAVAPQVQVVDFRDWVIEKHNWCAIRAARNEVNGTWAYLNAKSLDGSPYDYLFFFKNKNWYCSELVREVLKEYLPENLKDPKKTILPEDFYQAAKKGDLIVIKEHRDKE